jgi:subtilisin family serine protease
MVIVLRFLAPILLAVSSLGAAPNPEIRLEPPVRSAVIVEFHATAAVPATFERFRRDVATLDRRAGKRSLDSIRHEYVRAIFGAAVDAPPETIDAIRRLPYVRAVHPDRTVTMYATSKPAPAAAAIDAAARVNAGSLPTRGEGIRVGVIDSGIDYTHPALGGGFGPGFKVAGGWDFVNNDGDPRDDAGHGTHVAGIIAADSAEIAGVAPAVTLIAYKVLSAQGSGRDSDVIAAIERSIDPNQDGNPADHLDVINISLGGPGTSDHPASRAADNAVAAGVIVVAAAGNGYVTGSIGSPGTARTAITVGAVDAYGDVAGFSSRGPSSGSLELKPDVLAPGVAIPSTVLGGSIFPMTGTSMAAPHVAGAAALLRKLHPEWTPADVKSALMTTAIEVIDVPTARAAGRIDTARAAAATTFIDGAGIGFGLASAKSGSWESVRSVAVTNRGAAPTTFDVVATNVPAGATLTTSPATLQLAPGESKSVELRLIVNGAIAAFPSHPIAGGDIEFRGATPFALPWCVVRAARITVAYDKPAQVVLALSGSNTRLLPLYEEGTAELFTTPDSVWDFMLIAYDQDEHGTTSAVRLAFAESVRASGDDDVVMRREQMTAEAIFDSRDEHGTLFTELPQRFNQLRSLRFLSAKQPGLAVGVRFPSGTPRMFLSPVSANYTLHFFEGYFDVENGRAYNVQHRPLSGIATSETLSVGGAAYKRARIRFPTPLSGPNATFACQTHGLRMGSTQFVGLDGCSPVELGPAMLLRYFTTEESGAGMSGMDFDVGQTAIGRLRGIEGAIVPVPWFNPSPTAYRIADGEEITLGASPLIPFAFFGTAPNYYIGLPPGFVGPLGDWYRYVTSGTSWTMFDAANTQISSGVYTNLTTCDDGPCDEGPLPLPRGRYVATRDGMKIDGHASRGELEVRFGGDTADLIAPTLTSLRVVNAQGRMLQRLEGNSNATLVFSATDLFYPPMQERKTGSTRDLKGEATRVSYRVTGTSEWHSLSVVHEGSDLGGVATLGYFPAGELYRADLSVVTRVSGLVDLRVEIEDVPGNHTTWIQTPAFVVGTATTPKRRRAVR